MTSGSYVRARGAVSLQQSTVYRSVMYTACAFVSYSSPSVSFSKPILIHEFQLRAQRIPLHPHHVADTQCREYRFRLPSYVQSRRYSFSPDFERERRREDNLRIVHLPTDSSSRRISFEKNRIVDGGKMEEGEGAASDGFPPLPSFRYSQLFCRSDKGGARSK